MILSVSGSIAWLDQPSVDGRQLSREGLTLPTAARPLLALHAGINPSLGHYGAEPVGSLGAWDVVQDGEDSWALEVAGDVYDDQRIPPGRYPCGIDARFENEDAERTPDERWPDDGLLIVRKWSPIAVTLHLPGSSATPAFPDAFLTVERPV